MTEKEYKKMRAKYLPQKIKNIFILESPPKSGKYFYNPDGSIGEPLYRATMQALFGINHNIKNKEEGLSRFRDEGYVLVDSIYEPVNGIKNKKEVNKKILSNYLNLKQDLNDLLKKDKGVGIILAKSNVCKLLEEPLFSDGFNVLNKGVRVPFPLYGWERMFKYLLCSFLGVYGSTYFKYSQDEEYFIKKLAKGDRDLFRKSYLCLFDFRDSIEKRKEFDKKRNRIYKFLLNNNGDSCQICGKRKGSEVDYIIPLSSNILNKKLRNMKSEKVDGKIKKVVSESYGSNNIKNLQLVCNTCNREKWNNFYSPVI